MSNLISIFLLEYAEADLELDDLWYDLKLPFVSSLRVAFEYVKAGLDLNDIWPYLQIEIVFLLFFHLHSLMFHSTIYLEDPLV